MSDIAIPASTRTALLATQRTTALVDTKLENLATGLRINSPIANPSAFFAARSLSNRANDLLVVKDNIGQGASTLGSTFVGIDALGKTIDQLKAVLESARGGTDADRAAAAAQFETLRGQLDSLANDASFSGTALLGANPNDLTVVLNEDGSSTLTLEGVASDSASLGVDPAASGFNNFATDADIDAALAKLAAATNTLRSTAATFGTDASVLRIREDFTENLANSLQSGAAKLINADLNQEAAELLSLNVAARLGLISLNLTTQSQRAILQLF